MAKDPPPPPGTVLPKKYGDEAPGVPPVSRASRWTWPGEQASETVALDCDHLRVPALVEVSRALFAGTPHAGQVPRGVAVVLDVVWLTDGAQTGRTRLYADGTRTGERDGVEQIEAVLSPTEQDAVQMALATARQGGGPRCP